MEASRAELAQVTASGEDIERYEIIEGVRVEREPTGAFEMVLASWLCYLTRTHLESRARSGHRNRQVPPILRRRSIGRLPTTFRRRFAWCGSSIWISVGSTFLSRRRTSAYGNAPTPWIAARYCLAFVYPLPNCTKPWPNQHRLAAGPSPSSPTISSTSRIITLSCGTECYLKLTAFSGGNRVKGLTRAAGEGIRHCSRTSMLISRLPAAEEDCSRFRIIRVPAALDPFFQSLERHFHRNHCMSFRLLVVTMVFMGGAAQRRHPVAGSRCRAPPDPLQQFLLRRAVGSRGGPRPKGPGLAARPPSRPGRSDLLNH
jgi:hypothetical protein